MTLIATLFGVPATVIPPGLADFITYWNGELAGDTITMTELARRIAASALLPARLRDEYGLTWTRLHALALKPAAQTLKLTALPLVLAASHLRPS